MISASQKYFLKPDRLLSKIYFLKVSTFSMLSDQRSETTVRLHASVNLKNGDFYQFPVSECWDSSNNFGNFKSWYFYKWIFFMNAVFNMYVGPTTKTLVYTASKTFPFIAFRPVSPTSMQKFDCKLANSNMCHNFNFWRYRMSSCETQTDKISTEGNFVNPKSPLG